MGNFVRIENGSYVNMDLVVQVQVNDGRLAETYAVKLTTAAGNLQIHSTHKSEDEANEVMQALIKSSKTFTVEDWYQDVMKDLVSKVTFGTSASKLGISEEGLPCVEHIDSNMLYYKDPETGDKTVIMPEGINQPPIDEAAPPSIVWKKEAVPNQWKGYIDDKHYLTVKKLAAGKDKGSFCVLRDSDAFFTPTHSQTRKRFKNRNGVERTAIEWINNMGDSDNGKM